MADAHAVEAATCPPTGWELANHSIEIVVWPLVLVGALLLIAFNRAVQQFLGLAPKFIKSFKGPAGIEIAFNDEAAKKVRADFRESYSDFCKHAHEEYTRAAEAAQIEGLLKLIVERVAAVRIGAAPIGLEKIRATVHVRDVVFNDHFYQLVGYYPSSIAKSAGRRFSMRYGILGVAWRLEESMGKGDALDGVPELKKVSKFIEEWGMTREEAMRAPRDRPATVCVMLRSGGLVHGILYLDSTERNKFGYNESPHGETTADEVAQSIEALPETAMLAAALSDAMKPLRLTGAYLKIDE